MVRLMIFEPSFRRIEPELAKHAPVLEALLAGEDGTVSFGGAPVAPDAAAPDIAWADHALFENPAAARPFMVSLLKSPHLRWVQSAAAGFDHPVFASLVKKGVRLTTSHGQALGMADHVLGAVLDHFQRGPERRAAQAERAWRRLPFREATGTTWLIVGFGAIGQAVARRARGFGARIIGVRRDAAPHPLADAIIPLEAVVEHLPAADVAILCVPLSAGTRHLANTPFFSAMKPGSILVNVGRGALVDEAALLAALERGAPAHAALDVFETEPLAPDSPFWADPRVSVTPHASGMTGGQHLRNQQLFLENLGRFLAGQSLLHEADPADVRAARGAA